MTMSSQRSFFRFLFSVVTLVLLLHISFSLIGTSPMETNKTERSAQEQRIGELSQQIEALNQLVEELSNQDEHVLVLRIDQECFGGAATLQSTILQISVDRQFFASCSIGDDITDSARIRLLSSSILTDTRVYVEDMFIISR